MELRPEDPLEDIHRFESPDEAFQYVRYAGSLDDGEIDLGETALALALLFLPGLNPDRYRNQLKKLCEHAAEEWQVRKRMNEEDTLASRLALLKKIMHEMHGYKGDTETYDDIQNASMIRVIERRRGLPITLGILYIIIGRFLGWQMDGLNFPGHFLVRMEKEGARVIVDPFREGKEMDAADLRQLLKSIVGGSAELSHNFYEPVSNRSMLIRLQNNLKKRLIEMEEYASAIIVIEAMEALAPEEYRTLFDKGVLYAKLGQNRQATTALERYIDLTPDNNEKQFVRNLLRQLTD
jgi:regulator of sirC expression with transglutaminase-like and TPR domain